MKTADIKKIFDQAKLCVELNRKEKAKALLNKGLGLLGTMTMGGLLEVDGFKLDKWKNRFWLKLEEIGGIESEGDFDEVSDEEYHLAFDM